MPFLTFLTAASAPQKISKILGYVAELYGQTKVSATVLNGIANPGGQSATANVTGIMRWAAATALCLACLVLSQHD